jgi:hypothetical protein
MDEIDGSKISHIVALLIYAWYKLYQHYEPARLLTQVLGAVLLLSVIENCLYAIRTRYEKQACEECGKVVRSRDLVLDEFDDLVCRECAGNA